MIFSFFCLILGAVAGGVLTWLLIADHPFESREAPGGPVDPLEAGLLARQMDQEGSPVDEAAVSRVLQLHGAYVVGRISEEERQAEVDRAAAAMEASRAKDGAAKG